MRGTAGAGSRARAVAAAIACAACLLAPATATAAPSIAYAIPTGAGPWGLPPTIGGLASPTTTYHYRVVATNSSGTSYGALRSVNSSSQPPSATTDPASGVGSDGVTLKGTLNPNGSATTYHFDWGTTAGYGNQLPVPDRAVASDVATHPVAQRLAGLAPATTYHFRLVATNASGTAYGADQAVTTLPATTGTGTTTANGTDNGHGTGDTNGDTTGDTTGAKPHPVIGRSVVVRAASGSVLVTLPGSSRPASLGSLTSTIPVGATIDASHGAVSLTSVRDASGALQSGTFSGAAFVVRQSHTAHPFTVLSLAGTLVCPAHARAHAAGAARARISLWGHDHHGRFLTRGRSAAATVRGTDWLTQDTCAGTLVRVASGRVDVRDLVSRRSVVLRAGQRYLARTAR